VHGLIIHIFPNDILDLAAIWFRMPDPIGIIDRRRGR
jgi:hypothetical protein